MKNGIIILSHFVKNTDCHYLSYTHCHAKEYIKLGYDVYVFAPKAITSIKNIFTKNIVKIIDKVNIFMFNRLSFSNLFSKCMINFNGLFYYLSVNSKVTKLIKQKKIFYIDAHNFKSEGYSAYLFKKRFPNIKATITFHGSDLEQILSYNNGVKLLKKVSKYIDYFVCVSEKLEEKLNNIGIKNTKVIYNGIEFHKINDTSKLNWITSIGDLIETKNFDLLINAFERIHKKNSNYKLNIIGDGPLLNSLKEKVINLKLNDFVNFVGQISNEEVYSYLNRSKIFILPSSPEGFGIVYAEAMYNKCITIGVKKEGIDGFIKDGINGFLINLNEDEIYRIINKSINYKYDDLIKKAHIDASKLSWERNAKEYIQLILK